MSYRSFFYIVILYGMTRLISSLHGLDTASPRVVVTNQLRSSYQSRPPEHTTKYASNLCLLALLKSLSSRWESPPTLDIVKGYPSRREEVNSHTTILKSVIELKWESRLGSGKPTERLKYRIGGTGRLAFVVPIPYHITYYLF